MTTITLPPLHPSQLEIAKSPARFKVVNCGRRWGKTLLGVTLCVRTSLRGGRTWWIGQTYKQAGEGWSYAKQLAAQLGAATREGDMEVRFGGGGVLQVRTASDPENLRGAGLDGLCLDEAALADEELWSKVLRPALSDRKGWAVFISTPQGANWFQRLHDEAKTREGWASWSLPSWDRPTFDQAEVDSARRDGMSEDEIAQEFGASFLVSSDVIYDSFDRKRHLQFLRQGTRWAEGALGADYGDVHPSTVVAVTRDGDGRLWARECWYGDGDTGAWVAEMGRQCGAYSVSRARIRIDPTQRSIARGYGFKAAEMGDGSRRARIGLVKRLFNTDGLRFDLAGAGILRLAGEIEQYRWDRYPDNTLKDSPRRVGEDGVAALEYAIEELEGARHVDYAAFAGLSTGIVQRGGVGVR